MILPEGWSYATLSEVANIVMGQSPDGRFTNITGDGIPLVGGAADYDGYEIRSKKYTTAPKKICDKNDIILSIRATIGKVAIADKQYCVGRGVASFKPFINPKFLFYTLLANAKNLEEKGVGSTFLQIDKKTIENFKIQLPPIEEQIRIVDKLNELLRKTESVSKFVSQTDILIEKLRVAILESVYNGTITEEWRRAKNITEPKWVSLSEVIDKFDYGTSAKSSLSGRIPVLRMGNLQNGLINWDNLVYTSDEKEINKYLLSKGDVLFNRTNSPELVGKTSVYNGEREAIFAGYLIRLRCNEHVLPDYISYCINSPSGKAYCKRVKKDGVSQSNINAKKIAAFQIRLPSTEEQQVILENVQHAFRTLAKAKDQIIKANFLLPYLTQSILSSAVNGNLLPQNSSDSPSFKQLQVIQLEKQSYKEGIAENSSLHKYKESKMKNNLLEILEDAAGWLESQEAFQRCGITQNSTTEEIEPIYSQLRELDKLGRLEIKPIRDERGNKIGDNIKLKDLNHATT